MKLLCFLLFPLYIAFASPFNIDFPNKKELTFNDYIEVQNQIRDIDILSILQKLYGKPGELEWIVDLNDFENRCSKGINQILIDPENNLYPERNLIKIGKGGDRCLVCCAPLAGQYPDFVKSLIKELESKKFNGYFLYYIGGWPNPTGEEIQYVAVPYSFKIFAMVEAYLLGYNNVLWVDAACFPLRKIDCLFKIIDERGALLNWWPPSTNLCRYIFPETRQLLLDLSGVDVLKVNYINTIVFGLKMNTPLAREFVRTYYQYVRLGMPFFSCFPEEFVITAILGNEKFRSWQRSYPPLFRQSFDLGNDSLQEIQNVKKKGFYFFHRGHDNMSTRRPKKKFTKLS
jgi:hypothetical protein